MVKNIEINGDIIKDIILLAINGILLYFVYDLETRKCLCSDSWKRDYIKGYTISIIILSVISMLTKSFDKFPMIKELIGIAKAINTITLYLYIRELNDTNCICALENKKIYEFLKFQSLIGVIIIAAAGCVLLSIIVGKLGLPKYKK